MIQLCSSTLTISDGKNSWAFDPEELEGRILQSCIATGYRESWLAEDLTLALEDTLVEKRRLQPYHPEEINAFVIQALRDLGMHEIARHFSRHCGCKWEKIAPESDEALKIISQAGGDNPELPAKIALACRKLGKKQFTPQFLQALSREILIDNAEEPEHIPQPQISATWLLTREELCNALPPETETWLKHQLIVLPPGISRLFPALKIDLFICRFLELENMQPPLTELILLPRLRKFTEPLSLISESAENIIRERGWQMPLKLSMRCPDLELFTTKWLAGSWPEGLGTATEIIQQIAADFNGKICWRFPVEP